MFLQRTGLLYRLGRSVSPFILHYCAMLLVLFSFTCCQLTAQAQDSAEMSAVYGRGVHAYFANRMSGAEQLFSQVVQAGSTDPRVYYFRAMTRLRTGRQHEAEQDMTVGAAYEARDPGSRHSIGIALQRVQGQGRRTLERFRREGRLNRVQQRRQQSRLRYEQLDQRGPQVLRSETPLQPNQLSEPSMQLIVPENSPTLALPEPEKSSENPADPAPELEASDSNEDLFGSPAPEEPVTPEPVSPEPADANDDPFTDAAEIEAEPPRAEEEVAEPAAIDDLFGDPVPENENTKEESLEEAPTEEESNDESDDLFGDSDSTEPPAEDSTDSAEDDPFGEADETEADMEEESPAEETDFFDSEEEPADSTAEDDDPFSSTRPKDSSEVPSLTENDKVESGKLFGILGRVVGSTVPWKGMKLPTMNLPVNAQGAEDADSLEGVALGPLPAEPGEVTPASAESPVEEVAAEDDPFGNAVAEEADSEEGFPEEAFPESESSDEQDDLFDESDSIELPVDSAEDDPFGESPEATDAEEEDPFGEAPAEETGDFEASDSEEAEPMEESSESTEEESSDTEEDDLFGDSN